jgi:ADP-ribose pyrophosphatase
MNWSILSTDYIVKHPPFFTARKDVCRRPDGVLIPAYYVVEMAPAALTFGITKEGKVILIRQFRHPVNLVSLELPGGFVEDGEDPMEAAKREMEEETGYVFENFTSLGKIAANPGILNNFSYLFLATGGIKTDRLNPDVQEDIRIELAELQQVKQYIKEQEIIQSLHLNACFYALLHLNEMNL